jgi:transposase
MSSERQLMEQFHYNLLYRWFVGLGVDETVWVPTVYTKNQDRLLKAAVARKFLAGKKCGTAFGRATFPWTAAGSGLGLDEELCGEGRF